MEGGRLKAEGGKRGEKEEESRGGEGNSRHRRGGKDAEGSRERHGGVLHEEVQEKCIADRLHHTAPAGTTRQAVGGGENAAVEQDDQGQAKFVGKDSHCWATVSWRQEGRHGRTGPPLQLSRSGFKGNRMFRYFARLHEKFGLPIFPVAVF